MPLERTQEGYLHVRVPLELTQGDWYVRVPLELTQEGDLYECVPLELT